MTQLLSVWAALDLRRRMIVIIATVAMFAAILTISRMATSPSMTLLYAGLENSAAGDVISALEGQSVKYEIRGGAIFVETSKRDELRMTLASDGLPQNNSSGYELLDSLSGFGTTSQMFDAAYWRAKEGELARTILSSPYISGARVHIANPSSQPFRREQKQSASVTVTSTSGSLSSSHAKALKFLVASAVANLSPEDVAIIDTQAGLISSTNNGAPNFANDSTRTNAIKQRLERLLEARVGYGNAVVEVSVETITEHESIIEKSFDPESRVVISTDSEERTTSSEDARAGNVSVASNLPEGDGANDSNSSSSNTETRERVNYEVSETQREITKIPGAIKRLTIAVLVDGNLQVDSTGAEVFEPRSDEELSDLKELVSAAVGINENRGDIITIKSMEFMPIIEQGSTAPESMFTSLGIDIMTMIQLGALTIISLFLGLFVVRPILTNHVSPPIAEVPNLTSSKSIEPVPFPSDPVGSDINALPALTGEIENDAFSLPDMATASNFDLPDIGNTMGAFSTASDMGGDDTNNPVVRLRQLIEDRQDETVEVLRGWMEGEEEKV